MSLTMSQMNSSSAAPTFLSDITNVTERKVANMSSVCTAKKHVSAATPPRTPATVDSHTPRWDAESGTASRGPLFTKDEMKSDAPHSPDVKKHRPRKFLQNYFFLKNLNALPTTPEQKKKNTTSAQLRHRSLSNSAAVNVPPPPPVSACESNNNNNGGEEEHAPGQSVQRPCFDASTPGVLFSVDIFPKKKKSQKSKGENKYNRIPLRVSISRPECTALPPYVGKETVPVSKQFREDINTPAVIDRGSEEEEEEKKKTIVADVFKRPHSREKEDQKKHSASQSFLGETLSETDVADISAISAIHEEEVFLELCDVSTSQNEKYSERGMTCNEQEEQAHEQQQLGTLISLQNTEFIEEKMLQSPTQIFEGIDIFNENSITQWMMTSPAVAVTNHCPSTDNNSFHHFEKFLSLYFTEQFKMYEARVLDMAFMTGYNHMVARPMTQWLECYDRRLICMGRDIYIRNMIELFILTLPLRRKRLSTAYNNYCRSSLSQKKRIAAPTQRNNAESHPGKVRGKFSRVALQGLSSSSGSRGKTLLSVIGRSLKPKNATAGNHSQSSPNGPPPPPPPEQQQQHCRRLCAYGRVLPVWRERTPPPTPKADELMDVMKLVLS